MRIRKSINWDMDGTIANLYSVPDWLKKLRSEDPSPYLEADPMCDMKKLAEVLNLLKSAGWEINIITWLSMNSSEEYKDTVREAKLAWLNKWGFVYDHFHGVQYGATAVDTATGIRTLYTVSMCVVSCSIFADRPKSSQGVGKTEMGCMG